jgi:predicted nucleic acid-binding protein
VRGIAADSGPLIAFARGGLLGMLRQVAGNILVPAAVFAECCGNDRKPGASALLQARERGVFQVLEIEPPPEFRRIVHLGDGEMAVLASASIMACPALIDDRLGRKVAARHGIPVIGGACVLLAAKDRGLIEAIAPILADWRNWGYFLAPGLVDAILRRAGERP